MRTSYYGDMPKKKSAFVCIPMKNEMTVTDYMDWFLIQITLKIRTLADTK